MQIGDIDTALMTAVMGDISLRGEEPPQGPRTTPTGIDHSYSSNQSQPQQPSRIDIPHDGLSPVDDVPNTFATASATQESRHNVREDNSTSPNLVDAFIGMSQHSAPSLTDTPVRYRQQSTAQEEVPQVPVMTPREKLQEVVRLERLLDCCNTQDQRTFCLKQMHFNHLRGLMVEAYKCRYRDEWLPREPAYKRICRQKSASEEFYVLEKYCLDDPNLGLPVEDMQKSLFGNWSWTSPCSAPDPERGVATGPHDEREVYAAEPPVGETWASIAKEQKCGTRKKSANSTFCPFVQRLRSFGRRTGS